MSKLEGLGWIEYNSPIFVQNPKLSIEINGIDMVYFYSLFRFLFRLK